MDLFQLSLLLFLLSHLIPHGGAAVVTCPAASCSPDSSQSPQVHFPFRLRSRRQVRLQCGYPGFGLSCNNRTQTVLNLPSFGDFSVQEIDYKKQTIWLTDPDSCLPRRLLLLNFSFPRSSPFEAPFPREFTFLNCSSNSSVVSVLPMMSRVTCLDEHDYRVGYVPTMSMSLIDNNELLLHGCGVISTVLVPVASQHASDLNDGISFAWSEPDCGSCVARGGTCGLEDGSDMVVGCKNGPSKGLPRNAKYGIIVGLGIPGLLCLIGFACYLGGKITAYRQRRHPDRELSMTVLVPEPGALRLRQGLDGSTIASYPKTLIGESRRLPKPSDNTCAICLCEYESKETLRTIPECGHYFHADCIDEWLRTNGTCPLCRNSPPESAPMTPSEFISSSSSSSSRVFG